MTKSELVEKVVANHKHMTSKEAEYVINEFFHAISLALSEGERVELRGFGSFTTKKREARVGRNPKTGEAVQVPAKVVPHFKPGKELREKVDGNC
ncbi:MAG: integration host factor subunit beta [Zetaproteobacteria bacterium CG_4_9_14_3_um_filter_49_83]|nr:MAG: integration host factor subunit beta [Zetaproteobacteria bacterium CG1_02_49_23]PIQ33958.1 MAG: integration host factor subunit beta [Zetaproteobacteria bacterium CG17_big_fil_post_rev_8_21_14_2_50_50_13]PIV29885.1 MAG: integration host factor subunit beta [Zetaproteobacteria bacterium CG02_land_8_20_14_3_00_50_9]PIY56739.1 MAG: integration host factor subunit beta [Zetaproteobacteria bacterium CG_4_10_14_0_8_um_filter_49_80]PJA35959.1 MAG: integration host factor subunit beta [Zetaprot